MEIPKSSGQETSGLKTAFFSVITQRVTVSSYRLLGTTYPSHSQGSRTQKYTKTSVRNYRYSLLNNPEESSCQLLRGAACSRNIKFTSHVHTLNYILILLSINLIVSECFFSILCSETEAVNTFHNSTSNTSSLAI